MSRRIQGASNSLAPEVLMCPDFILSGAPHICTCDHASSADPLSYSSILHRPVASATVLGRRSFGKDWVFRAWW